MSKRKWFVCVYLGFWKKRGYCGKSLAEDLIYHTLNGNKLKKEIAADYLSELYSTLLSVHVIIVFHLLIPSSSDFCPSSITVTAVVRLVSLSGFSNPEHKS